MTQVETKLVGRVQRSFSTKKGAGWGFILTDDYKKFFFHSQYSTGQVLPQENALVRFRPVKQTAKGKHDIAVDIEIVSVPG